MPRKAANTASADDMVSNYEPCYHSLLFLSHPLYFSQYLSSMEMESIQHLQCWFYFDMLATVNISFLVLIYYFDFSPMISLSGYNVSVCVCVCVCVCACTHAHEHTQLCPTLCDTMQCSLPGSSVLEWVAISSSRGSFSLKDWTLISCTSSTGRSILYHWVTWGAF